MQEAMAYWGPDGDGLWSEGPVGLGCLKRVNTPESVAETLPWVCPHSGDVITASSRLDNRDELLGSLSVPAPERADAPDSRIILEAYHQWGKACVDRLLGDWVFAIWDAGERKLFVARDHHGNTGLYYHADSRRFTFASSLKGLLALPDVPDRPDPLTIAKAMTSWPEFGDRTCNEGILRLLPAHALTVTAEGVEVERHWYLEETPDLRLGSDDEYLEAFLEIFREAVRCRMRCTRPLAVTLSGGLDSGSVAALLARELGENGQRLPAFSSVPMAPTEGLVGWHVGDETPYIEATARFIGNVDVNYIDAREVSPVAAIERALSIHDQPLHGAQNLHWVIESMEEARRQGLGAIFTGQGGNFTISWHGGGPIAPLLVHLARGRWVRFLKRFQAWRRATGLSTLTGVRSQVIRPLLAPLRRRRLRPEATADAWREYSAINPDFARELELSDRMQQEGHDPTFAPIKDHKEAQLYLLRPGSAGYCHFWHEIGAAHGLEARDPTLDKRVMEFCWSIPRNQFRRDEQDRLLIRRAMAGHLPNEVRWNKRRGIQGADTGQRVVDHRDEIDSTLARLDRSELARHYLDLPRMRSVFDSVQQGIEYDNNHQSGSILLRGLMVGMFLLRFD
jgi:asparagine synthase (glutamine-hydrolysing)